MAVHRATPDDAGRRLLPSERTLLSGALLVVVASLVPWYRPERFRRDGRTNGWQEPDAILSQSATVIAIGVIAAVLLAAGGALRRPGVGGWSWGNLLLAAASVVTALVTLKFALNLERTSVGPYLALTGSAVMLYGAYLTRWDEPQGRRDIEDRWPETAYMLRAYVEPAPDLDHAVERYLATFAREPDRLGRLVEEMHRLASDPEARPVVAECSPRWAAADPQAVLAHLARGVAGPSDHP